MNHFHDPDFGPISADKPGRAEASALDAAGRPRLGWDVAGLRERIQSFATAAGLVESAIPATAFVASVYAATALVAAAVLGTPDPSCLVVPALAFVVTIALIVMPAILLGAGITWLATSLFVPSPPGHGLLGEIVGTLSMAFVIPCLVWRVRVDELSKGARADPRVLATLNWWNILERINLWSRLALLWVAASAFSSALLAVRRESTWSGDVLGSVAVIAWALAAASTPLSAVSGWRLARLLRIDGPDTFVLRFQGLATLGLLSNVQLVRIAGRRLQQAGLRKKPHRAYDGGWT